MRLDGVRVLDLTRLLPGPYATQLLADMGAEVVKIEDTEAGDYARYVDPFLDGVGGMFSMVNRGKKSVTLDLKSDEGREAFMRMAEDADVVFEQFRPGVADRLGVGYEEVKERNPDVVYCSLSGYGATGQRSDEPGHDLNYAGYSGLLDMTRGGDGEPTIPGYPVADMSAGLFAAFSIVSALTSRELGNTRGEHIDVGMADVALSFSQAVAPHVFDESSDEPRAGETALTGKYPSYDVYETADGEYLTLAAIEPKFWGAFCEKVGREHLIADHLSNDEETREEVREEIAEVIGSKTLDDWLDDFDASDVPVGPVRSLSEAVEDPQTEARGLIKRAGEVPRIGFPALSSEGEFGGDENVPDQGEHTEELLGEVGYTDEEIQKMEEKGAI